MPFFNRPITIRHFALLTFFAGASPALALDLSVEGAVQAALAGNRHIAAARFEVNLAHARLLKAGLLPNPELEFAGMNDFIADNDGEGAFTIGLSQRFPITARLGIAREVRRVAVAQALREIRNQERLLIAQTQTLYAQVQAARLREKATKQARESAVELVALTEKRVAAGQGSLAEGGLLRVEERRWWTLSIDAKTKAETRLLELKAILGLPSDATVNLTESLDAVVSRLRRSASDRIQRPDVEMALLEIDRAGAEIRLARAEAWEGIKLGIEYTYDHAVDEPSGLGTSQFLGLRVSVPLPVWNANRGAVEEGKALREQAEAKVRALELEVSSSIASAIRTVALYEDQLKSYRKSTEGILSASEKELEAGFKQGRVDLGDLLQVRAQSATLRIDSVTVLENVALSLIEWQAASGSHPSLSLPYTEASPRKSKKQP